MNKTRLYTLTSEGRRFLREDMFAVEVWSYMRKNKVATKTDIRASILYSVDLTLTLLAGEVWTIGV